jgi:hypothetical protein
MVDLAEHIIAVVALLAVGWSTAAFMFWHNWTMMEKKLDEVIAALQKIAVTLQDRVDWETFDYHKHDSEGRMVHGEK